jgi:hypothetical protein
MPPYSRGLKTPGFSARKFFVGGGDPGEQNHELNAVSKVSRCTSQLPPMVETAALKEGQIHYNINAD